MSFIETPRFPEDVSYGSTGGPNYRTDVVQLAGGAEARNSRWSYPLHRYDVAFGVRTQLQLETLLDYFHAMGGRLHGFRFKDWGDFKSNSATLSPADTDQVIGTGDAAETDFQLVKVYTTGSLSRTRVITKPVSGTVVVALDGVPQGSGWSVDTTTGVVSFVSPPGSSVVVSAGFEFDVPARFGIDSLVTNWEAWQIHAGIEVPVQEIRT